MQLPIYVPMKSHLKKFVHFKLNIPQDVTINASRSEAIIDFIRAYLVPVRFSKKEITAPGNWNYDDFLVIKLNVNSGPIFLAPNYVSKINNFIRRLLLDHLYTVAKYRVSNPDDLTKKKDIILEELEKMGIDTVEGKIGETMIRKVSELNIKRGELPIVTQRRKWGKELRNQQIQENIALSC